MNLKVALQALWAPGVYLHNSTGRNSVFVLCFMQWLLITGREFQLRLTYDLSLKTLNTIQLMMTQYLKQICIFCIQMPSDSCVFFNFLKATFLPTLTKILRSATFPI